jgi:hypothetical protein
MSPEAQERDPSITDQLRSLMTASLTRPDAYDQQMSGPGTENMQARLLNLDLDGQSIIVNQNVGYRGKDGRSVLEMRTPGAVGTDAMIHGELGFVDVQLFDDGKVHIVNIPTRDGINSRKITEPDERDMCLSLALSTLQRALEANPVPEAVAKKAKAGSMIGRLLPRMRPAK